MLKTKGSIIGAILLALVLISGLACGARPAQTPTSLPPSGPEITTNFITYTDESNIFSISYPSDWESDIYYNPDIEKDTIETKQIMNGLKIGLLKRQPILVFISGPKTAAGDGPCLNIVIESREPGMELTLDQELEADILLIKVGILKGYREFSRVKTTIGGRGAIIVDFEGTESGGGKRHYLMMVTFAGNTYWRVSCSSAAEDFAAWEKDFNTIIGSLQMTE